MHKGGKKALCYDLPFLINIVQTKTIWNKSVLVHNRRQVVFVAYICIRGVVI